MGGRSFGRSEQGRRFPGRDDVVAGAGARLDAVEFFALALAKVRVELLQPEDRTRRGLLRGRIPEQLVELRDDREALLIADILIVSTLGSSRVGDLDSLEALRLTARLTGRGALAYRGAQLLSFASKLTARQKIARKAASAGPPRHYHQRTASKKITHPNPQQ